MASGFDDQNYFGSTYSLPAEGSEKLAAEKASLFSCIISALMDSI